MTLIEFFAEYHRKFDLFELEILVAHELGKSREFVLAHPDCEMSPLKIKKLKLKISRRAKGEPIAYLTKRKEFYGLDFIVNKHTLIPRPETELLVENALELLRNMLRSKLRSKENFAVLDIGTGSGCIITAIANSMERGKWKVQRADEINYFATDISTEALKVAKKNARVHQVGKKIRFLHGNLLSPLTQDARYEIRDTSLIIMANLPYLSKEIYQSASIDVKKYEPKIALYSHEQGLQHYRKLLEQIDNLSIASHPLSTTIFLEISPEQKKLIADMIKNIFPLAKIEFIKDLAGKWRVCKIKL